MQNRWYNRLSAASLFLLLWVTLTSSAVLAGQYGVPFTKNGYDVDNGTDPICWSLPAANFDATLSASDFDMLPACYKGTTLKVTPLDAEHDGNIWVMYTGRSYQFQVRITVNYTTVFENATNIYFKDGNYTIAPGGISNGALFGFILCDTSKIGFCNPVVFTFIRDQKQPPGTPPQNSTEESAESDENASVANVSLTNTTNSTDYDKSQDDDFYAEGSIGRYVIEDIREGILSFNVTSIGANDSTIAFENKAVYSESNYLFTTNEIMVLGLVDNVTQMYETTALVSLQIPEDTQPGPYFALGSAEFFLGLENQTGGMNGTVDDNLPWIWVRMADAVPNNIIEIRDAPTIQQVSFAMRIGLGCVSGVAALLTLLILSYVVYHRDHTVMKVSQWQFMTWLVACATISNIFLFTYMPIKNWYCRTYSFLQLVPGTMIAAILIGRSWRVYVTLSPALSIGKFNSKDNSTGALFKKAVVASLSYAARFPSCTKLGRKKESAPKSPGGFRKKATAGETIKLILWLSLPQIILQLVAMIVYERRVEEDLDEWSTIGRYVCDDDGAWTRRVGVILLWAAYVAAVALAWVCRELPSAFQETDGIYQAASINGIVSLISLALDLLTDKASTPPDVSVFLQVITATVTGFTSVFFIVVPKMARVHSGEEVILSDLLAQHRISNHLSAASGLKYSTPDRNREQEIIHVKQHEPIPKELERDMIGVGRLLLQFRDELTQGRAPDQDEWQHLIAKVNDLNADFDRVQFEWTD